MLEDCLKTLIKSAGEIYAQVKTTWIETETKGGRGTDLSAIIQQNLALLGYDVGGKIKDFSKVKSLGNKDEMPAIGGR